MGKIEESYEWYHEGISLKSLGKHEEAISCFDTLISVFEFEDSDKWYNKGIALEKLGKDEEAEQCFAKAKELEDS